MIKAFKCRVPQFAIDDLKNRIKQTRWTDEIKDAGWQYGTNLFYMKELADYWLNNYDWRKTEDEINQYPNYIADIDGVKIHYLHIKGKRENSIPLILTHGWPGSFLEMTKIIPFLTTNHECSFDLIIPSIPGFGFSQKITTPGCNLWVIADLWSKLVRLLGYEKVIAQGGDFGAGISTALALRYPEIMLGLHLNFIEPSYSPFLPKGERLSEAEIQYQAKRNEYYELEGGYSHQQCSKPISLAYGLNDSPVGLCAWIVEKFYAWSDCNGNIACVFTKNELLANISLYWFTETIHSSIRLYNEDWKKPIHFSENDFINTPVGISKFAKETFPPKKFIERGYNIQHWTDFPNGGYFAAMEQPSELANDIIQFVKKLTVSN